MSKWAALAGMKFNGTVAVRYVAVWLAGPLALGATGFGAYQVWHQARRMTSYLPVEATIVSTELRRHVDRHGITTYEPHVKFRYAVNGVRYASENCLPADDRGRYAWASSILSRFQAGGRYPAYYDRADPSDAFLLRQYQFGPYLFVLFGCAMFAGMVYLYVGVRRLNARVPEPMLRPDGWYELRCPDPLRRQARRSFALAVAWAATVAATCGHYFAHAGPYEWFSYVVTVAAVGSVVPLALTAVRRAKISRGLETPRVFVRQAPATVGRPLEVRVEQTVAATPTTKVVHFEVALVCDVTDVVGAGEHSDIKTRPCARAAHGQAIKHGVRAGEVLKLASALSPDGPASTPRKQRGFPRHAWRVAVITTLDGARDRPNNFPLIVEAPRVG
jgi:hypothetical protein